MKNIKISLFIISIAFVALNIQADYKETRRERIAREREERRDRRYRRRDGTIVGDTAKGAAYVVDDTANAGLNILTLGGHERRREEDRRARERAQDQYYQDEDQYYREEHE